MTELERAVELLAEQAARQRPIVGFTGAGISAESGVPTFRGDGGIWARYDPERVATLEGFWEDPVHCWQFHEELRALCRASRPNPAHLALVWIATALGEAVATPVITQNIDGLHQAAGSREVIELHGSIHRVRCTECEFVSDDLPERFEQLPPYCHCGALLRPDVVWFGEQLSYHVLDQAQRCVQRAGAMLVIGTSAIVQPAAQLPIIALQSGTHLIEVNPEPTPLTPLVAVTLRGRAGEILPSLASELSRYLNDHVSDSAAETEGES